jgi:protocatechuate 3,4-dioxygenase beta subunit
VGVSVFVFHTDAEGRYARDSSGQDAELNPRLRGAMRRDMAGRFRFETIGQSCETRAVCGSRPGTSKW